MAFKIKTEPEAYQDIQDGVDWYNSQQSGLGRKFYSEVKAHINSLKINPFFQIRYDDVHCLPIKRYPYIIHYSINEMAKIVTIKAIFNTNKDPLSWKNRA